MTNFKFFSQIDLLVKSSPSWSYFLLWVIFHNVQWLSRAGSIDDATVAANKIHTRDFILGGECRVKVRRAFVCLRSVAWGGKTEKRERQDCDFLYVFYWRNRKTGQFIFTFVTSCVFSPINDCRVISLFWFSSTSARQLFSYTEHFYFHIKGHLITTCSKGTTNY